MLRNRMNLVTLFVLLGVSVLPGTTCFVTTRTTTTTTTRAATTRAGWPRRGEEEQRATASVLFPTTTCLQAQKKTKNEQRDPNSTAADRLRALGFSEEEIASTTKQARGATKRNPADEGGPNNNNRIGGIDPISLAAGLGVIVLLAFVFATLSDSANSPY